jgi:hypothetical protein
MPWCRRLTRMYGPAVRRKRFSSSCRFAVLHQCIRPCDWSVCSGPPWISARMRSHYRPGLKWAIWVTRVHMRREDRSSISSHPLADLGGKLMQCYVIACSSSVQFLCSCQEAVPPSRPAVDLRRRAQGPSSLAVALTSPLARGFQARLDGTEHGATLKQVGARSRLSWCIRSCAPC